MTPGGRPSAASAGGAGGSERTDNYEVAEAALDEALERSRVGEDQDVLAVLVIDAAGVEELDTTLGHEAGTSALAEVAERLRDAAPAHAALTMFPRDCFVLVCEGLADTLAATRIAEALVAAVAQPLVVGDLSVRLAAYVGIALAPGGRGTAAELLRDADAAARHARTVERDGWQLADPAARERSLRRLRLVDELGGALERRELTLHFQPIVSLRRGTVLGVEALLRWRHPSRGLVGAAHFVPAAQESDLIVEIGDWVTGEICRQVDLWAERHPERPLPPVSMNVSARELGERAFVSRLTAALGSTRVAPQSLVLEISGTGAAESPGAVRRALETLEAVKDLGVRLVVDGFGGEGSSIAQLVRLPVDGLKLDPMFMTDLGTRHGSSAIVEAVVDLGHALGLTVTAPGIETEEQLAVVRALSVDAAQGHLIGRPAPADSLLDIDAFERDLGAIGQSESGTSSEEDLVPLSAAADALGVSPSTVRRLTDQGVLPGTRTEGGHRRFRRGDVQRLARDRSTAPILKPWILPAAPLESAAMVLEHEGQSLVERTARAIYDAHRPGWFAAPQGRARSRQWLETLGEALTAGASREAVELTVAFLDTAALGGASAAECSRFLGQFTSIAMHELVRVRATSDEVRALQRLMSAAIETFLERLAQ